MKNTDTAAQLIFQTAALMQSDPNNFGFRRVVSHEEHVPFKLLVVHGPDDGAGLIQFMAEPTGAVLFAPWSVPQLNGLHPPLVVTCDNVGRFYVCGPYEDDAENFINAILREAGMSSEIAPVEVTGEDIPF